MDPLNILHVFRAPVGGLFRHVFDLASAQAVRGHRVGIIADSTTGGARAEAMLSRLAPSLALGLTRYPMRRQIGLGDLPALRHVMRRINDAKADIVHGHGAKGGAFARMAFNRRSAARAYTPHGGSLLFPQDSLAGKVYLATERLLMLGGDLYLFESGYSAEMFRRKIGEPRGLSRIVHNGVARSEFEPIPVKPDASDLVFMGELRMLKGVDVLIDAIAQLQAQGQPVTATLIGDGPDRAVFQAQVARLGLESTVHFTGAMPVRQALTLGRVMVVPSRLESLPYAVLETAAAGKPLITTRVGGIPEIFGPLSDRLVPADDAGALAAAIDQTLKQPEAALAVAESLRNRIAASFSIDSMVDGVLAAYQDVLAALHRSGRR